MFGFGKSKRDYRKICQDLGAVADLIYKDRSKTSEILGDKEFIDAWLDSDKQRDITMIIRKEAMGGDVPSLKQMVWILGKICSEVSSSNMEKTRKLEAIIGLLGERIGFCNQLIMRGIPQHYYAMISCHQLYQVLYDMNEPGNLKRTRDTINEMVEHAQAVISMGKDHPTFEGDAEFISDARGILREVEDLRKLLNALGDGVAELGNSQEPVSKSRSRIVGDPLPNEKDLPW